jgi:hypothetical protein
MISKVISRSLVLDSSDSGPMVRLNIMAAGVCGEEGCSPHGRHKAKKKQGTRD